MQLRKNKFIIFFLINILLLIFIFLVSLPLYNSLTKYFKKEYLSDNEFVKNSVIINPEAISPEIIDRTINIKFIAEVDSALNWDFKALQNTIEVKVGENNIIKFKGKNLSNKTITSTANFIASPDIIMPYLIKTECFCFTEQTLKPGESQIFTMVFFLDPILDSDKKLDDILDLVFTYRLSKYTS